MSTNTPIDMLQKELKRLQRELNSPRLNSYRIGDTSEAEQQRKAEREVKLSRFNEILNALNK